MDTSLYLYAAYAVFWLLPTLYVFRLIGRLTALEKRVAKALCSLEV